jgi:hypothetical protein
MQFEGSSTGTIGAEELDRDDYERASATLVTVVGLLAIVLLGGAAALFVVA